MRAWLIILAITSFTLAGTTVYFAHELAAEREARFAQTAAPGASPKPAMQLPEASGPVPPPIDTGVVEETPSPATAMTSQVAGGAMVAGTTPPEDIKKMQQDAARQFLEMISTPEGREDVIAQHKMMYRQVYPRVDRVLGLSPEEYSRFLEVLATQGVENQERQMRCMAEPDCDPRTLWNTSGDSRQATMNEFLGPERSAKFQNYTNTMGEREVVSQLRNRLPDAQRLSDESAESLITALAAERDAMSRASTSTTGYGFGAGMIMTSGDTFEERYETAQRNSQRLRDRAAQYLSGEQLRVFNEMQDETLVSLRAMLRRKDQVSYTGAAVAVTQ